MEGQALQIANPPVAVALGVREVPLDGVVGGGPRLTPQALHQLIDERGDDVVLFDGRNTREAAIGRFDGAVVPDVATTHDFIGQLDAGAFDRTTAAGVPMVMDACPAIEWRRR